MATATTILNIYALNIHATVIYKYFLSNLQAKLNYN